MEDFQAIRCMKNNDIKGLETLITRYQLKAVRAAFLITQDVSLAEDVVQETFIRIYQHIRYFDETRPFEPYLLRSVMNAAINAARCNAKHVSIDDDVYAMEKMLVQATSTESEVELAQLSDEIHSALSQLPPKQRAAIVQRYYLNMSEKEMALALDSPPGTVKWLLSAARSRLRDILVSERSEE